MFSQGKVCGGEEVHREVNGEAVRRQVSATKAERRGLPKGYLERDRRARVGQVEPLRCGAARGLRDEPRYYPRSGVVRHWTLKLKPKS